MCEDYVLGVLAGRSFLPSHGFPTGVVPFVYPLDELEEERAKDKSRRIKPYPQRQLDVAMREYAPGAEIVLDGLVHRSAGVTLNWRRPASEDGVREIQNLLWRWKCRSCGESGTSQTMDDVAACTSCGAAAPERFEYLQPAGFAADWRQKAHANPDVVSYVPTEAPRIGLGGATWSPLANPMQGRRRENRAGTVFHCSSGPGHDGYEICLHCGRAQAETGRADGEAWDHEPLFGKGRQTDSCTGSDNPFGIKRWLRLGYDVKTDVFEVQPRGIGTRGAGLAFAVALREALARRLGIGMEEMGVAAARRDKAIGGPISSFVFDRAVGGSGFSTQAGPMLDELLKEMESILDCKVEGCVKGCPVCVLSGDLTDEEAAILDRQSALEVTSNLAAAGIPDQQDLAVPGARLTSDVLDALLRSRTATTSRLVLRASAPLDVRAMSEWRATGLIRRWTDTGGKVVVSVPADALASMGGTALLALRDWVMTWGATLEEGHEVELANGAVILAEVFGADGGTTWATRDASLLTAGPTWGQPVAIPVVQFEATKDLLRGNPVTLDRLRPAPGAKIKSLEKELNGGLRTFGKRMVDVMRTALREAGVADGAIASVTYSDRYLNSPLTARMAIETLAVLTDAAPGKSVKARLEMSSLRPKDRWSTSLDDDWIREDDRQEVMLQYAGHLGLQLTIWRGKLAHARCMDIRFAAGHSARIYMDQGFGAWEVQSAPLYPFAEGTQKQVAAMMAADPRVTPRGPTYIAVEAR